MANKVGSILLSDEKTSDQSPEGFCVPSRDHQAQDQTSYPRYLLRGATPTGVSDTVYSGTNKYHVTGPKRLPGEASHTDYMDEPMTADQKPLSGA